jgi:hypothetical protein
MRGGYKPGGGRPRGPKCSAADIAREAIKAGQTPLEYMLAVMRDTEADPVRRDRMAMAAAPFCHVRADAEAEGKKAKRQASAEAAASEGKFAAPAGPKLAIDNTR